MDIGWIEKQYMDGWIEKKHGWLHEYQNEWMDRKKWMAKWTEENKIDGWLGRGVWKYGCLDGYNFF